MSTEDRQSWEEYFMAIAHAVATRATCNRKHVGCVLVVERRIIATGYNGSIAGLPHCDEVGHDMHEGHCVRTTHAEVNAIVQAARSGVSTRNADVFVNTFPCWPCFKVLAGAGVGRVFFDDAYREDARVYSASERTGIAIIGPTSGRPNDAGRAGWRR